jgi:two-component system cell cycle sensor histidine kinase/response regulator CckA
VAQLYASRQGTGDEAIGLLFLLETTEQKNLELQFAQSQKMQAVGQLAGGIAHDFNNLLTAIIGFSDLLLMRHSAGDQFFADIMQIKQNANRAANLVRQLLAFSRQQTLRPKVLDVTDVLAELSNLLRRLIGENIELRMVHGRDLGLVRVDPGQLDQVIINLAVNARDAMSNGGVLTIRTANVMAADVSALGHALMPAADYVLIEVSDTGHGIAKENLGKIFEPFFTTKEVGAGTGLGLSTVYGIVKQTGGFIFPTSEAGKGATFSIYLPRHVATGAEAAAAGEGTEREAGRDLTGKGTILLVEDEDAVRIFAARALRNKGYTVLEAASGDAALEIVTRHEGTIDLLISDVVMPNMDGPTLIKHARRHRQDMKIIFISGYAEDAFRKNLDRDEPFSFLPKPFSLKQLAGKVKEAIGGG